MTEPASDTVRTGRLLLRRARPDDLAAFHAMMADAETMRWWSTPPHGAVAVTADWLAKLIENRGDEFVIELDGAAIGKIGVWREAELGFFLARAETGKGYAREALAAFVAHSFARGLDHLTADVDPANAPCLALLARAGFRITGRAANTWLVGERWCGSVYLRLDRD